MDHSVYICTATKQAFASIEATTRPRTPCRLQTHLLITAYFFDSTATTPTAELITASVMRLGAKPVGTPEAAPLFYNAAPTESDDNYAFAWTSIDGEGLRELVGNNASADISFELAWTVGGNIDRVSWHAVVENAILRTADGAPDPEADGADAFVDDRAVCYDRNQSLTVSEQSQALDNIGITGIKGMSISNGALRIVLSNGDVVHTFLNSGEPPAP